MDAANSFSCLGLTALMEAAWDGYWQVVEVSHWL